MKKIIKRVVLCVFAVIIVAIAAAAAYLFVPRSAPDVNQTVTDASGNAYKVTKEGKENYAIVTDASGHYWAAEVDKNGVVGETKKSLDGKASAEDIITTYSGPNVDYSNNVGELTGNPVEVVTTAPNATAQPGASTPSQQGSTTASSGSQNSATTNAASEQNLRITKYKEIFASGNYYIEFTTNDETLGDTPIVAAAKNGNVIIDTKIDNYTCKILYLANKDKTYLLLDNFKMYCEVPESLMGDDFDMADLNMGTSLADKINIKSIQTSTVNIDGKSYYCESSKTKKGEIRFYFDGDSLVRFDTDSVDENGVKTTSSTYFSKITTDVPDSTFEIPSKYRYLNVSWLNALMGSSDSNAKSN